MKGADEAQGLASWQMRRSTARGYCIPRGWHKPGVGTPLGRGHGQGGSSGGSVRGRQSPMRDGGSLGRGKRPRINDGSIGSCGPAIALPCSASWRRSKWFTMSRAISGTRSSARTFASSPAHFVPCVLRRSTSSACGRSLEAGRTDLHHRRPTRQPACATDPEAQQDRDARFMARKRARTGRCVDRPGSERPLHALVSRPVHAAGQLRRVHASSCRRRTTLRSMSRFTTGASFQMDEGFRLGVLIPQRGDARPLVRGDTLVVETRTSPPPRRARRSAATPSASGPPTGNCTEKPARGRAVLMRVDADRLRYEFKVEDLLIQGLSH